MAMVKVAELQKQLGNKNMERVRTWYLTHVCGTQIECARDLKMNVSVVCRHVFKLRKGWRVVK